MKILVSACLLGENCKYNGCNNLCSQLKELLSKFEVFSICPEVLGGLCTPRPPAEISMGRVINKLGEDVTEQFVLGAKTSLKLALDNNINVAILKSRSPSCGKNLVYDGTFSKKLVFGMGLTAKILEENSIKVLDEEEALKFLREIN